MKREGNVIHADFGKREVTLDVSMKHEILYQDEHVALGRGTFQIGKHAFIVHATVERDA